MFPSHIFLLGKEFSVNLNIVLYFSEVIYYDSVDFSFIFTTLTEGRSDVPGLGRLILLNAVLRFLWGSGC